MNKFFSSKNFTLDSLTFQAVDYGIFNIFLFISLSLGIYFAYASRKRNTVEEYAMGGRKMKPIPVGISMVASLVSSLGLLAFPAEIYAFGINFYVGNVSIILSVIFLCTCVLPVFFNNNVTTCYEYLELRFDRRTRNLITAAHIAIYILLIPMYIFLPSLAFSQVTNINPHIINGVMTMICTFYTVIGGMKAIIWTDVVQAAIMIGVVIFIGVKGILSVGSLNETLCIAQEGHRLDVNFSFDLATRSTFWNLFSGVLIYRTAYIGFNQSNVQRLVSLPNLRQAQKSILIFLFLYVFVFSLNCFMGVIIYAYYHDCDPYLTGHVKKHDKIVPFFVQHIAGNIWGVPGLFISAIFSAAFSSASAAINSLAAVIYNEYIKPFIKHNDSKANCLIKFVTILLGVYSIMAGFFVDRFASFVQLLLTATGLTFGAISSCFTMGMLVPKVHAKAVFWATLISVVSMIFIAFNSKNIYTPMTGTTDGCPANFSLTNHSTIQASTSVNSTASGFNIFRASFNWYPAMGAAIAFTLSLVFTLMFPAENYAGFERKLFSPVVQRFLTYQPTPQRELH